MSNPHSTSKRVKLELDSDENKTNVSKGRGRSKTIDDPPSTFVKKELPDDPENMIFCTKCNTVFDNIKDL